VREIIIGKSTFQLGESGKAKINVAKLPSGTVIHINVHVFRGKEPGPSVLLLGGLHGDEINGVEIIRKSIAQGLYSNLKKGTIIAIPILNVYGFINFSRDVPDGKDVNRSFPGSLKGSLASRVAHVMTNKILPLIDFGVDFHTGGNSVSNFPQLRVTTGDAEAMKLAKIFAPPLIVEKLAIPKSHRKQGVKMGKPILIYEGGESLRLDHDAINAGIEGIHRLLVAHEMISGENDDKKTVILQQSRWIRASRSGIFDWKKAAGSTVKKNDVLGIVNNPEDGKATFIKAPLNGVIIGHNNNPVINRGDALFHLGY